MNDFGFGAAPRTLVGCAAAHGEGGFTPVPLFFVGNAKVKVAKFDSFYQSGQSFLARFGSGVRGKSDPEAFSKGLIAVHYNSGSSANGGRDGYAKLVKDAIEMVKARMQCGIK